MEVPRRGVAEPFGMHRNVGANALRISRRDRPARRHDRVPGNPDGVAGRGPQRTAPQALTAAVTAAPMVLATGASAHNDHSPANRSSPPRSAREVTLRSVTGAGRTGGQGRGRSTRLAGDRPRTRYTAVAHRPKRPLARDRDAAA